MRGGLWAVAALALLFSGPASAEPTGLEGRWRTPAHHGLVQIERCGPALCGRVVDAEVLRRNPDQRDVNNRDRSLRDRPVRGLTVLSGLTGGPKVWSAGPLYDPDSGMNARTGTVTLVDKDRLSVRGCIAPMVCRTQTWIRDR